MLIVTAPLWFKAPFKILRLFVREKLRERVFTVSVPQLTLHVPREYLPIHLGGQQQIDHSAWLLHCHKSMTNREDELSASIGTTQLPSEQPASPTSDLTAIHCTASNSLNGDNNATNGNDDTEIVCVDQQQITENHGVSIPFWLLAMTTFYIGAKSNLFSIFFGFGVCFRLG